MTEQCCVMTIIGWASQPRYIPVVHRTVLQSTTYPPVHAIQIHDMPILPSRESIVAAVAAKVVTMFINVHAHFQLLAFQGKRNRPGYGPHELDA